MTKLVTNPHQAQVLLPVSDLATAAHRRFCESPDVLMYGVLKIKERMKIAGMTYIARPGVRHTALFNGQHIARYRSTVTARMRNVLFTAHT